MVESAPEAMGIQLPESQSEAPSFNGGHGQGKENGTVIILSIEVSRHVSCASVPEFTVLLLYHDLLPCTGST